MLNHRETHIDPLDFNTNIGIGIKLPMLSNGNTFFALNYATFDQLKTNLKLLLLTEPGERYMLPNYGCGLRRFIFEGMVDDVATEIESYIRESVEYWIPKLNIDSVQIVADTRNIHKLTVRVMFSLKSDDTYNDTMIIDYMTI